MDVTARGEQRPVRAAAKRFITMMVAMLAAGTALIATGMSSRVPFPSLHVFQPDDPPWERIFPPGEGFSATFRGRPVHSTGTETSPLGPIRLESYTQYLRGRSLLLSVRYFDYPNGALLTDSEQVAYDNLRDGLLASNVGTTLTGEASISLRGHPGREVDASTPDEVWRIRLFLVGGRMFEVGITTTPELADDPDPEAFLGSFRLTGPRGAPARSPEPSGHGRHGRDLR